MDRNQVIGFGLLIALVLAYVFYNQHSQKEYLLQKTADSVNYARLHPRPIADSSKAVTHVAAAANDSASIAARKALPQAYNGTDQTVMLENQKLALQFSTKGAFPVRADIKGFKTYRQAPLYLFNGRNNEFNFVLPVNNGGVATSDLYFTPVTRNEPNGDKTIDFTADLGGGKKVEIVYTLPADDYMMQCNIHLTGMPATAVVLNWQTQGLHTEKDMTLERNSSQVYYHSTGDDHDFYNIRSDEKKSVSGQTHWVGVRKQYFSSVLVADGGFSKVELNLSPKQTDSNIVAQVQSIMDVPLKADGTAALRWYIGPNDYKILKSYKMDLDEMVPVGSGIMAFVKYINRYALIPIFYFLGGFISNYGIIIMIMTIFIRLILSFFTYKSYLSAAKMRVMKPEIDALRARLGDDQQKFGVEQMKLYRSVGINPMGGCLPTLFQLPFLFAMYNLFPSFIEFRQQHFLWVNDLSCYDSVLNLPFSIPFYGDHVSLLTILMTATTLILALYNRNMTPQDPNNPMMKYMPFIFPIILLPVFNKMAAALTFYYTFSNLISLTQQFVIQKYFINEKAIHAKLQEKPQQTSHAK